MKLIESMNVDLLASSAEQVAKNHSLTWGDFPDHRVYKAKLKRDDFYKMAPLHPKLIAAMEQVLHTDIPKLMAMLPDVRDTKPFPIHFGGC